MLAASSKLPMIPTQASCTIDITRASILVRHPGPGQRLCFTSVRPMGTCDDNTACRASYSAQHEASALSQGFLHRYVQNVYINLQHPARATCLTCSRPQPCCAAKAPPLLHQLLLHMATRSAWTHCCNTGNPNPSACNS